MTKLRQTIAGRLKEAQSAAAILTTFNEVDMSAVMELRDLQGRFREVARHEARLHGLLREGVLAGAEGPAVNAEIAATTSSTRITTTSASRSAPSRGLVVPVVRDADHLSLAEIEKASPISASGPRRQARIETCRAAPSPSPTAASTAR